MCGVLGVKAFMVRFGRDETAATAIEYGLMAAIIALGIVLALTDIKTGLNTIFGNVNTKLGS